MADPARPPNRLRSSPRWQARASSRAARAPLVDQPRCCILATHERDAVAPNRPLPQRQRPEAGRAWGPFFDRPTGFRRLASVHATRAACEAVELAYHVAGSVSLFDTSPLQRALRDVHAVRQHMMVADRYRQDVGRVLLGLEPKEALF